MSDTDNETTSLAQNKQETPKNKTKAPQTMESGATSAAEEVPQDSVQEEPTTPPPEEDNDNDNENTDNTDNNGDDNVDNNNATDATDTNADAEPEATDPTDAAAPETAAEADAQAEAEAETDANEKKGANPKKTKNNNNLAPAGASEDSFSETKESFTEDPGPSTQITYVHEMSKDKNDAVQDTDGVDDAEDAEAVKAEGADAATELVDVSKQPAQHPGHSYKGSIIDDDKDNPLLTTKLNPNQLLDYAMDDDNDNSGPPEVGRMPSFSASHKDPDTMGEYRNPSRRQSRCSPTHCIQWAMHNTIIGKIVIMILTWTTVVDYAKDIYVAYHLFDLNDVWPGIVTLAILFFSLRLMLYLRVTDDTVTLYKLLIFYLPGSVYADFQIDRASDVGVCCFWEFVILVGTPLMPFYLVFLSAKKSYSLFCGDKNFENPHLLAFAVVECLFEAIPQLILQTFLYFSEIHNKDSDEREIEPEVFIIAWVVTIIVLIKIPFITWYNWRIVHKLEFKRRHNGEVISVTYHPIRDIVASGSWDHTVLIHSYMDNIGVLKAKRVLDHHYNVNCIDFMPLNANLEIAARETNQQVRKYADNARFEVWKHGQAPAPTGTGGSVPGRPGADSSARLLAQRLDTMESERSNFNSKRDFQRTPDYSSDPDDARKKDDKDQNGSGESANDTDGNESSAVGSPRARERKILEYKGADVIAVGGQGIEIWHWRSGQIVSTFPKSQERDQFRRKKRKRTKEVKQVKFSPDGRRIIWCQGKNIHIWQIIDKRELGKIKAIQGNGLGDVLSIDVSPNGKYIAAGLYGGQIKVFNSYNCDCVRILQGHTGAVNSVKFDRDGRFVVSGSSDWTVRVWYLKTGEEVRRFQKHTSEVMCVAIDATNRYVASGGRDHMLYVTYLQDPKRAKSKVSTVSTLSMTTESPMQVPQRLNSGDSPQRTAAKQSSLGSRDQMPTATTGTESVSDASAVSQFSNFQPRMLSKRSSMAIEQMRKIEQFEEYKAERDIRCCDFSPYGEFVAVGCEDHTVNLVTLPDYCNNSGNNPSNPGSSRDVLKNQKGPKKGETESEKDADKTDDAAEYQVKIDVVEDERHVG